VLISKDDDELVKGNAKHAHKDQDEIGGLDSVIRPFDFQDIVACNQESKAYKKHAERTFQASIVFQLIVNQQRHPSQQSDSGHHKEVVVDEQQEFGQLF
jgi:beta-lactamase superfamily II metal-dependent hydrolase